MNKIVYLQADLKYGKHILDEINGKTVLDYTLNAISKLVGVEKIICGVCLCSENEKLIEQLNRYDIKVICSEEENVTKRMMDSLEDEQEGVIIRIGADQCLLNAEMTNYIIGELEKSGCDFFYEDSPTNSVIPDIVTLECLQKYEEMIYNKKRYFDALIEESSVKRLSLLLPILLFQFRANCYQGTRMCRIVIEKALDIYALSKLCANNMANPQSYILKNGLLSSWVLPWWEEFFVDEQKMHKPWWTVAAVEFVTPRLTKEMTVFEYGCGNSTLYFSQYVKQVISAEHDKEWHQKMLAICPDNVMLHLRESVDDGQYAKTITEQNCKFDIVLVDGADRDTCIYHAINQIKDNGVIIVDNAEMDYCAVGVKYLLDNGFKKINCEGAVYGVPFARNETAIFYKDKNCLGI